MRRVVLLVLAVFLFVPVAVAQDEGTLRDRIGDGKSRERSLASAADRLGELERKATREVVILEGRLGAAQQDLNEAETRLAATEARETAARRRVTRLRERLSEVRDKLSGLLRERYMGGRPDFVTVVLHADGFPQLLETLTFVKRVERADTRVLDLVRDARGEAGTEQRELERLAARQARERTAVLARRNALASITAGLRERRDTISRAHAARVAALKAHPLGPPQGRTRALPPARRPRPRRPRALHLRRPVGHPVADRPVRVRRPEPPAQPRRRLGLLPVHAGDLEGPRRIDPARVPGLQGRAGSPRGAPVGRRRGPPQLGLRRPGVGLCPACASSPTSPTGRRHLIEEARVAHLGLLDEDGHPRVQPITFARVGGSLFLAIDDKPKRRTPARIERLRSDPRATVTIDRYDDDWTQLAWVQVLATATIHDTPRRGDAGARATATRRTG